MKNSYIKEKKVYFILNDGVWDLPYRDLIGRIAQASS